MSSKTEIVIEDLLGVDWSLYIKQCLRALSCLLSYNYMCLSWGQFHLLYPLEEFYPLGKKKEKSTDTFSPTETGDHYC